MPSTIYNCLTSKRLLYWLFGPTAILVILLYRSNYISNLEPTVPTTPIAPTIPIAPIATTIPTATTVPTAPTASATPNVITTPTEPPITPPTPITRTPVPPIDYSTCPSSINYGKTSPNYRTPVVDVYADLGEDECHSSSVNLAAEDILETEFNCEDRMHFWLIWTTKRQDWQLLHYRVLDSIYTFHPTATVHVITKDMKSDDFSFYATHFDIQHHKLDVLKIFKHTPLYRWAEQSWPDPAIRNHPHFYSHLTDAMRLALLWKFGGVYLDTDAFLIKPIDKIRNAVGSQIKGGEINGAVMIFDRQHPFLYYAMHTFMRVHQLDKWEIVGPELITRCIVSWTELGPMMVRWLPTPYIIGSSPLPNEPIGTAQITVFMDQYQFYPISWFQDRVDINTTSALLPQLRKDFEDRTYVYHYFNRSIQVNKWKIVPGSFLHEMIQKNCIYACHIADIETSVENIN